MARSRDGKGLGRRAPADLVWMVGCGWAEVEGAEVMTLDGGRLTEGWRATISDSAGTGEPGEMGLTGWGRRSARGDGVSMGHAASGAARPGDAPLAAARDHLAGGAV